MSEKLAPNRIWTLAHGCVATGYHLEALRQLKKRDRLAPTDKAQGRGYTTAQLWVAALLHETTRLGLNHDRGTGLLAGVNYRASFWRERNPATPSLLSVKLFDDGTALGRKCNLQMVPELVGEWASAQSRPGIFFINVTAILSAVDEKLLDLLDDESGSVATEADE